MARPVEEEGLKGNKKGRAGPPRVLAFGRIASLAITLLCFFTGAYKSLSIRHANKKLLRTFKYLDPSIIEARTGMKVFTKDEFSTHTTNLEKARTDVGAMNTKLEGEKKHASNISTELQTMKKDTETMKTLIADVKALAGDAEKVAKAKADLATAHHDTMKAAHDAAVAKVAKATADLEAAKAAAELHTSDSAKAESDVKAAEAAKTAAHAMYAEADKAHTAAEAAMAAADAAAAVAGA